MCEKCKKLEREKGKLIKIILLLLKYIKSK